MAFNPKFLPAKTYKGFKFGIGAWPLVVRTALEEGVRDIDCLTDIVFYLHHPELGGRPLNSGETVLIAQWRHFRTLVGPFVSAHASDSRILVWGKEQEIRSGSHGAASARGYELSHRMWRSSNGNLLTAGHKFRLERHF